MYSFGHAHLPVRVVRFVIAQEGHCGDAGDHRADGIEPGIPLVMGLAVIDEVAHVDEELGILIVLPSRLRQGGPAAVVAGLGIGEDEALKLLPSAVRKGVQALRLSP